MLLEFEKCPDCGEMVRGDLAQYGCPVCGHRPKRNRYSGRLFKNVEPLIA